MKTLSEIQGSYSDRLARAVDQQDVYGVAHEVADSSQDVIYTDRAWELVKNTDRNHQGFDDFEESGGLAHCSNLDEAMTRIAYSIIASDCQEEITDERDSKLTELTDLQSRTEDELNELEDDDESKESLEEVIGKIQGEISKLEVI